jgi:hypothetical protein
MIYFNYRRVIRQVARVRRQGIYFPNSIPSYLIKQSRAAATMVRPVDVIKDEMLRAVLRKQLGNL